MHFVETYGYRILRTLFALIFAIAIALFALSQVPVNGLRSDIVLVLKNSENTGDYATTSVGSAEILAAARIRSVGEGHPKTFVERIFRSNGLMVVTSGYDTDMLTSDHVTLARSVTRDVRTAFRSDSNVTVHSAGAPYFYTRWIVVSIVFVVATILGTILSGMIMFLLRPLFRSGKNDLRYIRDDSVEYAHEKGDEIELEESQYETVEEEFSGYNDGADVVENRHTYVRDEGYVNPEMRVFHRQNNHTEHINDDHRRTHTYVGPSLGNVMTDGAYENNDEEEYTDDMHENDTHASESDGYQFDENLYESSPFRLPDYDEDANGEGVSIEPVEEELAEASKQIEEAEYEASHDSAPRVRAAQAAPHNLPVVDTQQITSENVSEASMTIPPRVATPPRGLPVMNEGSAEELSSKEDVVLDAVMDDAEPAREDSVEKDFVKLSDLATTTESEKVIVNAPQSVQAHEPTQDELKERLNRLLRGEL